MSADAQTELDLIARYVREKFPDAQVPETPAPGEVCAVVFELLAELKGRQIIGKWGA